MSLFSSKTQATQELVAIKEVRDGVAILNDGGLRVILLATSVNFALKSAENQQAIISQFQNFLNSLDFSVQIFMESRRLDIRPYIALLEGRYKAQNVDLMRVQIQEYMNFIKKFTETVNIMSKSFFVVVPYSTPVIESRGGSLGKLLIGKQPGAREDENENKMSRFEEARSQLLQRVSVVEQGLAGCGIRAAQLGTEEIIELFYKLFNPGETDKPLQAQ